MLGSKISTSLRPRIFFSSPWGIQDQRYPSVVREVTVPIVINGWLRFHSNHSGMWGMSQKKCGNTSYGCANTSKDVLSDIWTNQTILGSPVGIENWDFAVQLQKLQGAKSVALWLTRNQLWLWPLGTPIYLSMLLKNSRRITLDIG